MKGIARHQLLNDPRVHMSVHDGCSAIHIAGDHEGHPGALGERKTGFFAYPAEEAYGEDGAIGPNGQEDE